MQFPTAALRLLPLCLLALLPRYPSAVPTRTSASATAAAARFAQRLSAAATGAVPVTPFLVPVWQGQQFTGPDLGPGLLLKALQGEASKLSLASPQTFKVGDFGKPASGKGTDSSGHHPASESRDDIKASDHDAVWDGVHKVFEGAVAQLREAQAQSKRRRLLFLGGDHVLASGTIGAMLAHDAKTNVVYVDAHADISNRQPGTTQYPYLHGHPVAAAMGLDSYKANRPHGDALLPAGQLAYAGLRHLKCTAFRDLMCFLGTPAGAAATARAGDFSPPESCEGETKDNTCALDAGSPLCKKQKDTQAGVKCRLEAAPTFMNLTPKEVSADGAAAAKRVLEKWGYTTGTAGGKKPCIHISFDIDSLDPSLTPATGTPVPGGISLAGIEGFFGTLSPHVCSMDVVEFNPALGSGDAETATAPSSADGPTSKATATTLHNVVKAVLAAFSKPLV